MGIIGKVAYYQIGNMAGPNVWQLVLLMTPWLWKCMKQISKKLT